MQEFVLILTMIMNGGNDGQGGVATANFKSEALCESAGKAWLDKVNAAADKKWSGISDAGSFYVCVPKGGE